MIEDLYCVRDTFFPLDPSIKKVRLDNLMQQALIVLAEIASGAASRLVVFDVSCFWNQFCFVFSVLVLGESLFASFTTFVLRIKGRREEEFVVCENAEELSRGLCWKCLECRKQPEQRAQWEYLRGKVLDAGPDYCKEAEDHLAKSVLTFCPFHESLFLVEKNYICY